MANIPNIQKALYPNIPKIDSSIPYPFKYLQKYSVSLEFLANIPVSLKTFQCFINLVILHRKQNYPKLFATTTRLCRQSACSSHL